VAKISLERMVNQEMKNVKKTMVTSDYHIPHVDKKAYKTMLHFARDYNPDTFVINGDMLDMYTLSVFDKTPDRKEDIQSDLYKGRQVLGEIREALPKARIIYLEGNHETRLQRFMWRNPEIANMDALDIRNLLDLDKYSVEYIGTDLDYWKKDNGHLNIGDTLIMHGDNRINGASTSKYSGYSAKNTMMTMQSSVIIGHTHRMGQVFHNTPYSELTGIELKPGDIVQEM